MEFGTFIGDDLQGPYFTCVVTDWIIMELIIYTHIASLTYYIMLVMHLCIPLDHITSLLFDSSFLFSFVLFNCLVLYFLFFSFRVCDTRNSLPLPLLFSPVNVPCVAIRTCGSQISHGSRHRQTCGRLPMYTFRSIS